VTVKIKKTGKKLIFLKTWLLPPPPPPHNGNSCLILNKAQNNNSSQNFYVSDGTTSVFNKLRWGFPLVKAG
jgi:hypothetical protein